MRNELTNDYYLERFILGELPDEESMELRVLIAGDAALQKKIEEIETSNRDIIAHYPPTNFRAKIKNRLKEDQRARLPNASLLSFLTGKKILAFSAALISFALIVFLIDPFRRDQPMTFPFDMSSDTSLIKGLSRIDFSTTQLLVFRKSKDLVDILRDGHRAKVGDLLQLAYVAKQNKYGMILSLDARGAITLHYPSGLSESTELEMNRQFFLPNAFELDDAPEFERFLFVTSDSPIDVSYVLEQAKKLAMAPGQAKKERLELPQNFTQYSVLIIKGEEK